MTINKDILDTIVMNGQIAHSRGVSRFGNPYDNLDYLPCKTGESLEDWEAKREAWRLGWQHQEDKLNERGKRC